MEKSRLIVLACIVAGTLFGVPAIVGGLNENARTALTETLEVTEAAMIEADKGCDDIKL